MTSSASAQHNTHSGDDAFSRTIFGFWIYLMTDCVLFATLFATYAVLHNSTDGGPGAAALFSLPFALTETLILLTSSFTSGLAMLAIHRCQKKLVLVWFFVTFALGAAFLGMELTEFSRLIHEGNSWSRNAFLSSFFTLVGTHGLHITCGLLWMGVVMAQVLFRGVTIATLRRTTCLCMFWHFLDIVWIFIFTVVYLMGVK